MMRYIHLPFHCGMRTRMYILQQWNMFFSPELFERYKEQTMLKEGLHYSPHSDTVAMHVCWYIRFSQYLNQCDLELIQSSLKIVYKGQAEKTTACTPPFDCCRLARCVHTVSLSCQTAEAKYNIEIPQTQSGCPIKYVHI